MKEKILLNFPGSKYSLEKTKSGYFNTILFKDYSIFITTNFDYPFIATVFKGKERVGSLIDEDKLDAVFNKINHIINSTETIIGPSGH